jgi:hypothetical protein
LGIELCVWLKTSGWLAIDRSEVATRNAGHITLRGQSADARRPAERRENEGRALLTPA